MKLTFITEARFVKDQEGNIYTESAFSYALWQRYLMIYTSIYVLARVKYEQEIDESYSFLSSGEGVKFIELPYYIGPYQYLIKKNKIDRIIKDFVNSNTDSVFVCRVPGVIAGVAIKHLTRAKKSYGVEVVGDPWETFSHSILKQPLSLAFKYLGYISLKRSVNNSLAALYVTKDSLQKRYPPIKDTFHVSASDVIIKDNLIGTVAKSYQKKDYYEILSIGSLAQLYKAPDVLIKSLKILNDNGLYCRLRWLGDGVYKQQMESLTEELQITDLVEFKGNVNANEVRKYLLQADVFALVSRTEGLPRALIEAMSAGLPCIGTNVGGIPELLENIALVPKNDVLSLVEKIKQMITDSDFYNQQASRNLLESHNYKESVLQEKRNSFYNYLIGKKNAINS